MTANSYRRIHSTASFHVKWFRPSFVMGNVQLVHRQENPLRFKQLLELICRRFAFHGGVMVSRRSQLGAPA